MRVRTLEIRWHDSKPISTCDFQPAPFKKARPAQDRHFPAQAYRLATGGEWSLDVVLSYELNHDDGRKSFPLVLVNWAPSSSEMSLLTLHASGLINFQNTVRPPRLACLPIA